MSAPLDEVRTCTDVGTPTCVPEVALAVTQSSVSKQRGLWPVVHELVGSLTQAREENHIAERLMQAFGTEAR